MGTFKIFYNNGIDTEVIYAYCYYIDKARTHWFEIHPSLWRQVMGVSRVRYLGGGRKVIERKEAMKKQYHKTKRKKVVGNFVSPSASWTDTYLSPMKVISNKVTDVAKEALLVMLDEKYRKVLAQIVKKIN